MHGAAHFPVLTVMTVLPGIGAFIVTLLSNRRPEYVKLVGVAISVATGAMALWMLSSFRTGEAGYQFVSNHRWIEQWGIGWHLGVDGISLFLVVLTGILFPIALLGAPAHHDDKAYTAWMLLLETAVLGSFVTLDLFLFFVFFELVLVPMYFLIGGWGHGRNVYAALKFYLFTMGGSVFMFVGIIATVFLARKSVGHVSFDLVELTEKATFASSTARWLFASFAIAFAVKVPMFPVHTWLPDAHTEAPTAGSVILASLLLKIGAYGFLRFGFSLFPDAARWFRPLFLTLAVIGILYGAIVSAMQKDLKRLVAYSSVAHLGFIMLGVFAFTSQSIAGGVLQMLNHGVSTGALFLLIGMIYERRHTRIIAELGGIQSVAPIFAAAFTIVMLSSIAVPGLNGFVGEFLVLIGSFLTARWWAVAAGCGVIFAAVYLLWAYQRVFHGVPNEENKTFRELSWGEGLVMLPLVGLILFCGIYPKPLLDRIEPSVNALIAHIEERTGYTQPQPALFGGGQTAAGQTEEGN